MRHPAGCRAGKIQGRHRRPLGEAAVPPKYTDPKTTDLVVEVVEEPAADQYDLRLKK